MQTTTELMAREFLDKVLEKHLNFDKPTKPELQEVSYDLDLILTSFRAASKVKNKTLFAFISVCVTALLTLDKVQLISLMDCMADYINKEKLND